MSEAYIVWEPHDDPIVRFHYVLPNGVPEGCLCSITIVQISSYILTVSLQFRASSDTIITEKLAKHLAVYHVLLFNR